jgi:shikimate kinase
VGKSVRVAPGQVANAIGVCLVGFMGAGKSSVGRALGAQLDSQFEDLDDRIVRREGRSIAEIFRASGEAAFRRAESAALREVLAEMHGGVAKVLALGGGAFVQKRNAAALKKAGLPVIFLDAPVDELWQRCCRQAEEAGRERPLLRSADEFRQLYDSRRGGYLQASLTIDTAGRTVNAIAAEIAKQSRFAEAKLVEVKKGRKKK